MVCSKCGETITCPYFFNGHPYGYTCIKLVNPNVRKHKKNSQYWVEADSFQELLSKDGDYKIRAFYKGVKFIDIHYTPSQSKVIFLQNGKAYIDLIKYNYNRPCTIADLIQQSKMQTL